MQLLSLLLLLCCRGRKVSDMRPKRPSSSPGPGDSVGSALAAVWPLLVQGDADGVLLSWDLATGHCSSLATGAAQQQQCQLAEHVLVSSTSMCKQYTCCCPGKSGWAQSLRAIAEQPARSISSKHAVLCTDNALLQLQVADHFGGLSCCAVWLQAVVWCGASC
jgi:hypothetical protein